MSVRASCACSSTDRTYCAQGNAQGESHRSGSHPSHSVRVGHERGTLRATMAIMPNLTAKVDSDHNDDVPRWAYLWCWLFAGAAVAVVLLPPGPVLAGGTSVWPARPFHVALEAVVRLRWRLAVLVSSPLLLSAVVAAKLIKPAERVKRMFQLVIDRPPLDHRALDREEDEAQWIHMKDAVMTTWEYEKERVLGSLCRVPLKAMTFGTIASFALMCCVLALTAGRSPSEELPRASYGLIAAIATAFSANLVRIIVRVSSGDVTAKTLAWATRSLVLVIVADVGLFVVLKDVVQSPSSAILLGVFVGATGDHAIQFLLEKGSAVFKVGTPAAVGPSPLLGIEGMTTEHVERLEEEGILSVHDLAFVPTARLFFTTAYSLQQICNWQDAALLLVYVGKDATKVLGDKMQIRGAIDLRAVAHDILFSPGDAENLKMRDSLQKALNLDDGGLLSLLRSMAHDEVTMRARLYWASAVAPASLEPQPTSGENGGSHGEAPRVIEYFEESVSASVLGAHSPAGR